MEPSNNRFGGGAMDTVLHPLFAVVMLVAIVLLFLLPRKYAAIPFLLSAFLIPLGQVVVVGGVHFTTLRIVTIFGVIRCTTLGSKIAGGFNAIDRYFTLWALAYAISFVLLYQDGGALINRLGFLLDSLGGYFVLRCLIRNEEDVRRVVRLFVIIAGIMAVCMVNEHFRQQNVFGIFGGTRPTPEVRDGHVRANGVFQHSILAGSFGATLLPLFLTDWKDRRRRIYSLLGMTFASIIVVSASASTAVLAYAAGIVAVCFWPMRKQMRAFRWAVMLTLIVLHLAMKAPVWALISRIDLTGSSSSYHRYMLMDNCIRHFWDWWLFGSKNYGNWGWDMWDLSNQYVAYAVTGGLASLIFFVGIISSGFGKLGRARKQLAGAKQEWLVWSVGAGLFAHMVAYFGIGYFDQTQVGWFMLLAIICAISSKPIRQADVAPQATKERWDSELTALPVSSL